MRLEAATWSYVCMCVRVCSVSECERDIVLDSDKMEDYYFVYCIYILSIFSKLYFFPHVVTVLTDFFHVLIISIEAARH